jgi:outer membrane protein TolC
VDSDVSLHDLIAQSIAARPELGRHGALADASMTRVNQEHWRPWLPHVYAGMSGGGFGGNDDSTIENFSGRSDFDVAAVWELESFGLGNAARRRREDSRYRQANLAAEQAQDLIAEEVTRAFRRVESRRLQIEATQPQLSAATRALELNFDGIRGAVLRPIEAQQAISALADARFQHLDVVLDYNAAQLNLLRAVGTPPSGDIIDVMAPSADATGFE